jgi:hypothetical protein
MCDRVQVSIFVIITLFYYNSCLPLKALSEICLSTLQSIFSDMPSLNNESLLRSFSNLSDLICTNAERKSFGVRDKSSLSTVIYDCDSRDALWFWELSNPLVLSTEK